MARPVSNKDYKVKDKATGQWITVKGVPTPVQEHKKYESRKSYKRRGYDGELK